MKVVDHDDELMIITMDGVVVRTPVSGVSQLGRSTQGVHVMNVADKDKVTAVAIATDSTKKSSKSSTASVDENQTSLLDEG